MHICFVFGLEPWLLPPAVEMAEALRSMGHEVKIIYAQYSGAQPDARDYDTGFTQAIVPKQVGYKRFFIPAHLRKEVRKLLKTTRFDAVIACDILSLQAVAGLWGVKAGYWGFEIIEPPKQLKMSLQLYRAIWFPRWVERMSFFLAPSQSRVQKIAARLAKRVKSEVIYNCRRLQPTNPTNDHKIIVYTGRISATQYIDELVDAMTLVEKEVTLHLAGPAGEEYLQQLNDKINTNDGLKGRVVLHGRLSREEAYRLNATAGIGVVLYNSTMSDEANDPAPNKLSDYIAAGIWSIGTSQPYMQYWLQERGAGTCVDTVNKQTIAAAINKILTDGRYQNREVLNRIYRDELNMEAQAQKLIALLHTIR